MQLLNLSCSLFTYLLYYIGLLFVTAILRYFYKQEKQEIPQEMDKAQLSRNKANWAIFSGHFGYIQS